MQLTAELRNDLPEELCPPTHCPYCNAALEIDGAFPLCPNYNCSQRTYGRLQKFVDVLDVKGCGEETLLQLVKLGIAKTPGDLFHVTLEQFCSIERKGEKGYKKFKDGLEAKRDMSVAEFFASLDIEGQGTWEAICRVPGLQTLSSVLTAKPWDLSQAERVSIEKAHAIIKEMAEKMEDINRLSLQVRFKQAGTKLTGKTFVITGTLTKPRPQIEKEIKTAGGAVGSSVSAKTSYLVTNEVSNSSKSQKAKQLGIPVITEAQLYEMLK